VNDDYVNHLLACRESHLQAIALIDQLLGKAGKQAIAVPPPPPSRETEGIVQSAERKRGPNKRNGTSKSKLLHSILQEANRPLKLHEILGELGKRGYKFESVYPKGTLNPLLYGSARLQFVGRTPAGFVLKGRGRELGFEELDPAVVARPENSP